MKRLLSVIHTPVFGGPHNQMLRLDAPLRNRGWDTIVLMPDESDSTGSARLESAGLQIVKMPLHRLRAKTSPTYHIDYVKGFYPEIQQIQQLIRDLKIDLVQVCGLMNPHGAIAASSMGIPVVWQLLGTTAPAPLRWLLMPLVLRLADAVMATGAATARAHPGAQTMDERLVLFSPPVDSTLFAPNEVLRQRARQLLHCSEDSFVIGTVGNRNKLKGHEHIVGLAAAIRRRYPHVITRILGAQTTHATYYDQHVVALAKRLGLLDFQHLEFVDPGQNVPQLLPALDIFLLTSRVEGMPTVVLEAMATGIPVVTFDVGSVKEIVSDGETGYVIPAEQPAQLVDKVTGLIENKELRMSMGQKARECILERYDINACADLHVHAYDLAAQYRRQRH